MNRYQRKLDEAKQKAFIAAYENLVNSMGDDKATLLGDAGRIERAPRRLLGAVRREGGDRTDERASAH